VQAPQVVLRYDGAGTLRTDGAWINMGSVRPPVESLVGVGGHRNEAYRQLSTIVRRQSYWTLNPAYEYIHFSYGEHTFNGYQELRGDALSIMDAFEKETHHYFCYI